MFIFIFMSGPAHVPDFPVASHCTLRESQSPHDRLDAIQDVVPVALSPFSDLIFHYSSSLLSFWISCAGFITVFFYKAGMFLPKHLCSCCMLFWPDIGTGAFSLIPFMSVFKCYLFLSETFPHHSLQPLSFVFSSLCSSIFFCIFCMFL